MVPDLSYGSSGLGLLADGSAEEERGIAAVHQALRRGVDYLDTAPWYGRSEAVLGKALSGLSRDSFRLATKVGRYPGDYANMFDFSAKRTLRSVQDSLAKTGVSYFDVLQVHDVEFAPTVDVILEETLPALETLRQAGVTRYIGITGYPLQKLREIIERSPVKIDIVLSYCRGTLFDQALRDYIPFFQSLGVGVANAAPLGMGLLTRGPPPHWHPATDELKDACARSYAFCQESGVSLEKLSLGYSLHKFPGVHTTIVGMNSPDTLQDNIDSMSVTEDEETLADLVQRKFFQPLAHRHWEGREIEKIRSKLARQ